MIGTIITFAGREDKIPGNGTFMLCDGRALSRIDFHALFQVIGTLHGAGDGVKTFNIPDYRGYFLRGVSGASNADPDRDSRLPAAPGGTSGNDVGTVQGSATALPRAGFVTDTHPGHAHSDPTWNGQGGPFELAVGAARGPGGFDFGPQAAPTSTAGEHAHAIRGGDAETRPQNKAVHFLIQVK